MNSAANIQIEIRLIRAPDDPQINAPAYQNELSAFSSVLRERGITYSQRGMVFDSAAGGGFPLGQYIIPIATGVVGAISAACVAWLNARSRRKVRIKIGDVEAEASTIKEVDALLKRAADFQTDTAEDDDS
jgi:hypothetical protein